MSKVQEKPNTIKSDADRTHLAAIYEHAPIGIVEGSLEGMHVNVNEEFCRITGYDRNELLTLRVKDISFQDDYLKEATLFEQLISGEISSYKIEKRYIRKDGEIIWVEVIRSTVRDSEGKALYVVGIVQDITARRQAEAQIRFQADLLENVHDAIIATDELLRITSWNRAAEELYGWTAEEAVGRPIIEVIKAEFTSEQRASISIQEKINKDNTSNVEAIHHHRHGYTLQVEARSITLRSEYGEVTGYVTSIRDISRRKQVEEALQQLNLELESRVENRTAQLLEANHALVESRKRLQALSQRLVEVQEDERRMIARELHDRVGQTLSALNINLLIMKDGLSEDSKERLGSRMKDSIELLTETISLVRGLMNELRPANLDDYGLKPALQAYLADYSARYNINVLLDLADEPVLRQNPSLEITLLRIAQEALTNIARHAHATETIISLRRENTIFHFTIFDNGIGIEASKGDMQRISHGLKIMRERAEALGGTINIDSSENGTKVETRIPIKTLLQNNL
jgi:PAS domain S-box-containing protein